MFRSRSWFGGGGLWKPKNPHSLEHLKYLYNVLSKNQTVSESNRSLLVETLRSIAEILIWGDQNDSTVFDFFLEKNMLSFFLRIMRQKCGSYVCVQLLQTLNILFENIRNETSLYYLLSNNHVNSIIVHKFDFSDEEVMAYYISFLKTLSLKLNSHTIHFFYNEGTHDFPLYTEAIKFFNNSESMVRIAVRTLTLNVYRVDDKSMLKFIRDKTAAPYFSNLVWFIGTHVFDLDKCIRSCTGQTPGPRLPDLVAEHLDHLHYLNDILCLEIDDLNQVLTEHLLHRLFVPTYIAALDKNNNCNNGQGKVGRILAIFLLSQVFLIMTHSPLVRLLANVILNGNEELFQYTPEVLPPTTLNFNSQTRNNSIDEDDGVSQNSSGVVDMEQSSSTNNLSNHKSDSSENEEETNVAVLDTTSTSMNIASNNNNRIVNSSPTPSASKQFVTTLEASIPTNLENLEDLTKRPFLASIYESLSIEENDYGAVFALCLLHSLNDNAGINPELLHRFFGGGTDSCSNQCENHEVDRQYNKYLVDCLISIICAAVKSESKVRVITLQLVNSLLLKTVMRDSESSFMSDAHLASIEGAREENILLLQNYYKTDELFLEIFEDEYLEMNSAKALSIEHLMMDSNLLLPPAGSPLTGIPFDKRLPCGEVERSRRAIRVYFILRSLSLVLRNETENFLPLTNTQTCVHIEQNLDLTNSDMLACSVITRDNVKTRRFLVIDIFQLILVEPSRRLGWGIAKFVGFLQDMEVLGDKDDSRCLHITIKTSPTCQRSSQNRAPILVAKFLFDDHIRCMAAKQRLVKGKQKARQRKLHMIARLLDLNGSYQPSPPQQRKQTSHNRRPLTRSDRPLFNPVSRNVPGLAKAVVVNETNSEGRRKSRDNSPGLASNKINQEEEIPLGNIQRLQQQQNSSTSSTSNEPNSKSVSAPAISQAQQRNLVSKPTSLPIIHSQSQANSTVNNTTDGSSNPITSPLSDTTPQSETSFMTLPTTFQPTNPQIVEEIQSHSNSAPSTNSYSTTGSKPKNKKKKGIIETV